MLGYVLFVIACAGTTAEGFKSKLVLIGSTPGDGEIKQLLGIDPAKAIDFIRWDLGLGVGDNTFLLNINYGVGEPNTRGFKGGGETATIRGTYAFYKDAKGELLRLTTDKAVITLLKLNENVFHILTAQNKLMIGTGGWGYSLARKEPVKNTPSPLTSWTTTLLDTDRTPELVFEGRTPCVDLGRVELPYTEGCLKLKWRLTLFRDAQTHRPTGYKLEGTLNRRQALEGKWFFVNGTRESPRALIVRLDPDTTDRPISFLVGDENVLFFLGKDEQPLAGNDDFGFALSRRRQQE